MLFNLFCVYLYVVRKGLYNYCYITIVICGFRELIRMASNQSKLQTLLPESKEIKNNVTSIGSEVFQILLLKNDENRSVEVIETPTIPLDELVERLKHGESVFLTYKSAQSNQNLVQRKIENLNEPWYFTHF